MKFKTLAFLSVFLLAKVVFSQTIHLNTATTNSQAALAAALSALGITSANGASLTGNQAWANINTNFVVTGGLIETNPLTGSFTAIRAGWFIATNAQTGSYEVMTNASITLSNFQTGQWIILSNGVVTASSFMGIGGTNTFRLGTRTFTHDGSHTLITNTASLTASEWTSGSQFEWYNGAKTVTIDKTNGSITATSFIGNGAGLSSVTGVTTNLVVDTSAAAVYYVLPTPATTPYTIIKTNASFPLYVSYSTTTNVISGDGVWVEAKPVNASWFLRW